MFAVSGSNPNTIYPGEDVDWEDEECQIKCYLPGGDPVGVEGDPIWGEYPINPYTGRRYNVDDVDIMFDYEELEEPGQNAAKRSDDENHDCPYEELEPPEELQEGALPRAVGADPKKGKGYFYDMKT